MRSCEVRGIFSRACTPLGGNFSHYYNHRSNKQNLKRESKDALLWWRGGGVGFLAAAAFAESIDPPKQNVTGQKEAGEDENQLG